MTKIDITDNTMEEIKNFQSKYGDGHIQTDCGQTYWVLETHYSKFNLGDFGPHYI